MPEQNFAILIFVLWFILPIIPAFLLYKFLPGNQVWVKGPFKGLTVDLAGAFAAYFLLFLGSYIVVNKMLFHEKERFEVWTVKGTVQDDMGRILNNDRNKPSVMLLPSIEINNGRFDFPVSVRVKDGFYDFPMISITAISNDQQNLFIGQDASDFLDMDVDKSAVNKDGNWEYNFHRNTIRYRRALKLTKEQMEDTTRYKVVVNGPNSYDINPNK